MDIQNEKKDQNKWKIKKTVLFVKQLSQFSNTASDFLQFSPYILLSFHDKLIRIRTKT